MEIEAERQDEIIQKLKEILISFVSVNKITKSCVEIYHQDSTDATLAWKGNDEIERSIHFFIKGIGIYTAILEVNAWKDSESELKRISRGKELVGIQLGSYPTFFPKKVLKKINSEIERAYKIVSSWSESDLVDVSPLSPWPRRF